MYNVFFTYLKTFNSDPMSDEEKALIMKAFVPARMRKRQFLLQAGSHSKNMAFIVKGSMRMFTVDDKGSEHMVRLGVEGWWMGDRESWSANKPSRYYIDCWQHTDVLLINRENTLELMRTVPAFCEMLRQLDERNQIANNRRLNSSISADIQQRYTEFVETYPDLHDRFPQHIVASYLGVNKDTLSRVKRRRLPK